MVRDGGLGFVSKSGAKAVAKPIGFFGPLAANASPWTGTRQAPPPLLTSDGLRPPERFRGGSDPWASRDACLAASLSVSLLSRAHECVRAQIRQSPPAHEAVTFRLEWCNRVPPPS